ncbi:MAG: cellulase family glycosylhydrolase [Bacteroidales bacterium]|nr:cellulase family glycosylhydrolase [Bacteroidales bacterium]
MKSILLLFILFNIAGCNIKPSTSEREIWSYEKAQEWQSKTGWMCGANFIPSSAINQLEMWQSETFDTATINRELGWAENMGMNVMRVYLHHLAWEQDQKGFKQRMNKFLEIASNHNIQIMFVFFDDCWNPTAQPGKQPDPVPGKHNSGWLQDPGKPANTDTSLFPKLENYVKDIMNSFATDNRIVIWDVYNEPNGSENSSLKLLQKVFQWARESKAEQPVTSAIWDWNLKDYNHFQLHNSDIISYHNYGDSTSQKIQIDSLKKYNRPLICSEYMARRNNSTFQTILPILRRENVSAINWGLVSGKTNTIYAWDDTTHNNGSEPELWFHDILRKDGSAYSQEEVFLISKLTWKN